MPTNEKVYPSPELFNTSNEIVQALENLADEYKESFSLFVDGYKYLEISERLNVPVGEVKYRIYFTRRKLANILIEYL